MTETTRKVAFFFFETRDINTYPSITNAVRLLTENNYNVDLYLPSAMKSDSRFPGAAFIIVSRQNPYSYISNSVKHIRENDIYYDFLFAFSIEGLFVLSRLNKGRPNKIPSAYFSMELIYGDYLYKLFAEFVGGIRIRPLLPCLFGLSVRAKYLTTFSLYYYYLQSSGRKFVKFSIVQDENRGKVLKSEFKFVDRIFCVPNSYIDYSDEFSDFAFRKFGIQPDRKILLYTGSVEKGFDLSLFDMSRDLSDEYVLFINAYSRDRYLEKIMGNYGNEIKNGKLIFNRTNLNEEDYGNLVKSSHICLAWYQKVDPEIFNMYYLGFSSGKLTKFLSCGRPVIAPNYFYGYHELIDGNRLGGTCECAKEIPGLLKHIEENYTAIRQNIKKFYLKNLEFRKKFEPVMIEMGRYIDNADLSNKNSNKAKDD